MAKEPILLGFYCLNFSRVIRVVGRVGGDLGGVYGCKQKPITRGLAGRQECFILHSSSLNQ